MRRALSTQPKRSNSAAVAYAPEYEDSTSRDDSRAPAPLNPEQRKFLDGAVSVSFSYFEFKISDRKSSV